MLTHFQNRIQFPQEGSVSLCTINPSRLYLLIIEPVPVGGQKSAKNALALLAQFGYDEEESESSKIAIHVRTTGRGRVNCPATLRSRLSCQRGRFSPFGFPPSVDPRLGLAEEQPNRAPGIVSVSDAETMSAHFYCPLFVV